MNWPTLVLFFIVSAVPVHGLTQTAPMPWTDVRWQTVATDAAELPAVLARQRDGWLAYAIDRAYSGTTLCCYRGFPHQPLIPGCTVGKASRIYGNSSTLPPSTRLTLLIHLNAGQVDHLQMLGDHCPVDGAGHTITWLGERSTESSMAWLNQLSRSHHDDDIASQALTGLARHHHPQTPAMLATLARELPAERASIAVLGLGAVANPANRTQLQQLLSTLPPGEPRHHISFALAQHDHADAWQLLRDTARHDNDPQQRISSIHALSNNPSATTLSLISELAQTDPDANIQHAALHTLSEYTSPQALAALQTIARSHPRSELRGQAWYVLLEKAPQQTLPTVMHLLQQPQPQTLVEFIIAGIADLDSPQSADHLIHLTGVHYPQHVRRAALFRLADSDDPQVIDALVSAISD